MNKIKSKKLKNISSLAFGGKDLKDIYMGVCYEEIADLQTILQG